MMKGLWGTWSGWSGWEDRKGEWDREVKEMKSVMAGVVTVRISVLVKSACYII